MLQQANGNPKQQVEEDLKDDDFNTVIHAKGVEHTGSATVNPSDVDAFWLQRTIARYYTDPHTAQEKTIASMEILEAQNSTARDIENNLVELYGYDHFDLVKLLTQNRDTIIWCTRLQKVEDEEDKAALEQEMRDAGVFWIAESLNGAPAAVKPTNGSVPDQDLDVDNDVEMENTTPSTSSQPKETVDLEALAFEQGGHFMSNKKVRLPEGTFKRSKKGYEEVHVPAPVPKPMEGSEKLRPITSMPAWSRNAFSSANSLNRIQSKVYPTAFESDENMLLCAPTGAGK